jgi:2-keto-4-pentenoate hydratase/2-oxohepta-3-ene-1,7-dioic acid hydratase in catechol pathway
MTRAFTSTIFQEVLDELQIQKAEINYVGDISDLGNEVGYIIGRVYKKMSQEEINDFITGFMHGVSLTNGTH